MIMHIVGARPQFIKLAPVCQAFDEHGLAYRILHTGQHYDAALNDVHFSTLGLPQPHVHLGLGSASHARQTASMLTGIEEVLLREKPALVVVYGDTNSTLAGALTAAKLGIRIAHVEAGVRSFDRSMPEEINRVITDRIASYRFCPTHNAMDLLQKEGLSGILTGDVMLDALNTYSARHIDHPFRAPFILTTIHRAENTDERERFLAIWDALCQLARTIPVVFPVHPRTLNRFRLIIEDPGHAVTVIDPVSYLTMIAMMRDAACIVTDSGGVQKEAFLLRTPCVTVRDSTEWPETVLAGANRLVHPERQTLVAAVTHMLTTEVAPSQNPFGDGRASCHIAAFIREHCL